MFYEAIHAAVPPLLKAVWRPTVLGRENVPKEGGVILASNHLRLPSSQPYSNLDIFAVASQEGFYGHFLLAGRLEALNEQRIGSAADNELFVFGASYTWRERFF